MSEQKGFLAGFGKIDITPDYPVGLRGYANDGTRIHEMVVDKVYATCIAVTEEDKTILMFTVDHCGLGQNMVEWIRNSASEATNVPVENIFCAATHTHSAPSTGAHPNALRYRGDLVLGCVKAAVEAMADRAPATILVGKQNVPGMNFVRHYVKKSGGVAGVAFGSFKDDPPVAHTAQSDTELMLVKFQREEMKQSIVMVNWQGHPDCSAQIGKLNIAASYPGILRDALALYTGDLIAYFTGDDGNTVIDSSLQDEKHYLNWREYGVKMAEYAYSLYKNLQPMEAAGIATCRRVVEVETDHGMDHRIDDANEVFKVWKEVGLTEGNALAKSVGFSSVYQANAIRNKFHMEKTRTLELNAFRIGDIGFTSGTYEMFSESGMAIRAGSPFEHTFLLTGNFTYLPSKAAYDYQCYEAVTGYYARGTAEFLDQNYLEMLNQIR